MSYPVCVDPTDYVLFEYKRFDGVLFDADAAVRMQLKNGRMSFEELYKVFAREADNVSDVVGCA